MKEGVGGSLSVTISVSRPDIFLAIMFNDTSPTYPELDVPGQWCYSEYDRLLIRCLILDTISLKIEPKYWFETSGCLYCHFLPWLVTGSISTRDDTPSKNLRLQTAYVQLAWVVKLDLGSAVSPSTNMCDELKEKSSVKMDEHQALFFLKELTTYLLLPAAVILLRSSIRLPGITGSPPHPRYLSQGTLGCRRVKVVN